MTLGILCANGGTTSGSGRDQWRRNELKMGRGDIGPARKWEGAPIRREVSENFVFGRVPLLFSSKSTISRFGERFRDVSTLWSVSCLLFFYSRCPPPVPSHL